MLEMMTTLTMTNSPQESTESDSYRRDSTTISSDLSGGSHVSSCSPPLKRPRLDDLRNANIIDETDSKNLSKEEELASFIDLMCFVEPIESPCLDYEDKFVMYAELVLSCYKDTTGEDFVVSRVRSLAPFPPREGRPKGGTHLNFFAHPRGSEEESLFYGEVQHLPKDPEVVDCFKFPCGIDEGLDLILHPPHVDCRYCELIFIGRELDDDEGYH